MIFVMLACADPPVAPPVAPMPPPVLAAAEFSVHVGPLPMPLRTQMMGVSWHEGCPVSLDELAWIQASHWDFNGQIRVGELVVAAEHAQVFIDVLRAAFDAHYPIERMQPVSHYQGSDKKSMASNNTSAFNCRAVTGGTRYSEHSYGHAIDINPLRNPYISRSGRVQPVEGEAFADRSKDFKGRITAESAIVKAFAAHGWGWGGTWTNSKDYQHFSVNHR